MGRGALCSPNSGAIGAIPAAIAALTQPKAVQLLPSVRQTQQLQRLQPPGARMLEYRMTFLGREAGVYFWSFQAESPHSQLGNASCVQFRLSADLQRLAPEWLPEMGL